MKLDQSTEQQMMGTTAAVCLIVDGILYTAHCGDARVIFKNNHQIMQTSDHKIDSEMERIKSFGGSVFGGRLLGQIAVARAIGDHGFKSAGLSAFPEIHKHEINQLEFVIVGCDGIFDVLDTEAVANII